MRWNWQLPEWPNFRFDADPIRASEEQFLKGSGIVIGSLHHLDAEERDGLTIELISQEIVDSPRSKEKSSTAPASSRR